MEAKRTADLAREDATSDTEWLALETARFCKPWSRWFGHSLRRAQIATLDRAWEAQVATLHTARAHQCLRHARPDPRGSFFSLKICRLFWINKIRSEVVKMTFLTMESERLKCF